MGAGETFNGRSFSKVLMLQLEVSKKGEWKGMGPTGTSRESEPHKDRRESFSFSLAQILHLQDGDVPFVIQKKSNDYSLNHISI